MFLNIGGFYFCLTFQTHHTRFFCLLYQCYVFETRKPIVNVKNQKVIFINFFISNFPQDRNEQLRRKRSVFARSRFTRRYSDLTWLFKAQAFTHSTSDSSFSRNTVSSSRSWSSTPLLSLIITAKTNIAFFANLHVH